MPSSFGAVTLRVYGPRMLDLFEKPSCFHRGNQRMEHGHTSDLCFMRFYKGKI